MCTILDKIWYILVSPSCFSFVMLVVEINRSFVLGRYLRKGFRLTCKSGRINIKLRCALYSIVDKIRYISVSPSCFSFVMLVVKINRSFVLGRYLRKGFRLTCKSGRINIKLRCALYSIVDKIQYILVSPSCFSFVMLVVKINRSFVLGRYLRKGFRLTCKSGRINIKLRCALFSIKYGTFQYHLLVLVSPSSC